MMSPRTAETLTLLLVAPWRRWYVFFPVLLAIPCTFFGWRAFASGAPPASPSSPQGEVLAWGVCALVALSCATFLAWAFEAFDPRLSRVSDVERTLRWPVLAEFPFDECVAIMGKAPGRLAPGNRPAYERFADRVASMSEEYELRSFAVTSTRDGEGKTSIAIHVAAVLARRGYRVILVDTCFDVPTIHRHFGLDNDDGLSDLLEAIPMDRESAGAIFARHEERFSRALLATSLERLQVISAGRNRSVSPKYSEKEYFQPFVHQMRRLADVVIFDTPPVGLTSPAVACTASVDGCLFVVGAGRTDRRDALGARQQLKTDRVNALGVLFNHADRPAFRIGRDAEVRRPANVDRSPTKITNGVNQT